MAKKRSNKHRQGQRNGQRQQGGQKPQSLPKGKEEIDKSALEKAEPDKTDPKEETTVTAQEEYAGSEELTELFSEESNTLEREDVAPEEEPEEFEGREDVAPEEEPEEFEGQEDVAPEEEPEEFEGQEDIAPEEFEEFEDIEEELSEFEELDEDEFDIEDVLEEPEDEEKISSEVDFEELDEEEAVSQGENEEPEDEEETFSEVDFAELSDAEEASSELDFVELSDEEASAEVESAGPDVTETSQKEPAEHAELEAAAGEAEASYWDDAAHSVKDEEEAEKSWEGVNPLRVIAAVRIFILLLIFAGVIYLLLPFYSVKLELTIEAGESCPPVQDFLKWKSKNAVYVSGINENTVLDRVGDYGVVIRIYGRKVAAVLHVVDTVAPNIETRNVSIFGGDGVEIGDFVADIEDVTPVTVRFMRKPDCVTEGITTVLLEVEDEGGNITTAEAILEVIYDTEPPIIQGVKELTMTAGTSISYKKGITVTDNYDQNVKLNVDTSQVDTGRAGDYTVTYTAADSKGNETMVSTVLHVLPLTIETVTEENINAEADKILATILTDSMSQYERAKAIYDWCHDKIAYSDGAQHMPSWIQEAYRGLVNRRGDCYVYAATAKCLLTRAGIDNLDIERIPKGDSRHQWNLIDIGEGWHHFDTCRRYDGSTFFYKTDAEIAAYSNTHNGTHNYDKSLYPEIP